MPCAMDYPKEHSKSLYDYSDKSIQHAGYAAIAYAAISLFSGVLAWVQYFLYHRPGKSSVLPMILLHSSTSSTHRWLRRWLLHSALYSLPFLLFLGSSFFAASVLQSSPWWCSSRSCSFTRG